METLPVDLEHSGSFHRYLPLSDQIFHSGIYAVGAGVDQIRPGEAYPPARHPSLYQFSWKEGRTLSEFCVMLMTGGAGEFESKETGLVELHAGTAIFLFPDVWHRYRPQSNLGWKLKWVQFNGEIPHQLMDQG